MPLTIPTSEPDRLTAGDTWQWTKAPPAFPVSEGWALSYVVTGPSTIKFSATPDGSVYAVTVAPATTKVPGGTYRWACYATLAGARHQVDSGILIVEPNLDALTGGSSSQSFAVRTLAVVEAAIEGRLPAGIEEYQVAGKAIKHFGLAELMQLRAKLRHEVVAEQNGGKLGRLEATFVPA